jgi:hypothetical protein
VRCRRPTHEGWASPPPSVSRLAGGVAELLQAPAAFGADALAKPEVLAVDGLQQLGAGVSPLTGRSGW